MKPFCILLVVLFGCCAEVKADWTTADTARQTAYTLLTAADALTTMDIRNHDDLVEAAPIARTVLGANPQPGATAAYFGSMAVINYTIARMLKPQHRVLWQSFSIAVGAGYVANNVSLGLRFGF